MARFSILGEPRMLQKLVGTFHIGLKTVMLDHCLKQFGLKCFTAPLTKKATARKRSKQQGKAATSS